MATFQFKISSKKKGSAAEAARYAIRDGKHEFNGDDVAFIQSYNLPDWTNGNPITFFRAADKYERKNGSACRALILALPNELTMDENIAMVSAYIEATLQDKASLLVVHDHVGALSGEAQPHAHVFWSDRVQDGIERDQEQTFKRYNPLDPTSGGCRKDSGGKDPRAQREALEAQRGAWAEALNNTLESKGQSARVDHRSYRDRGMDRQAEVHLGPKRIKEMSLAEKKEFVGNRAKIKEMT